MLAQIIAFLATICLTGPVWGQRQLIYAVFELAPNHAGDRVLFRTMRALPSYSFDGKDRLYLADGSSVRRPIEDPRCPTSVGSVWASSPSFVPGSDSEFSYHANYVCGIARLARLFTLIRLPNHPWIADGTPGTLHWGAIGTHAIIRPGTIESDRLIRLSDGTSWTLPQKDAEDRILSLGDFQQGVSERGEVMMLTVKASGSSTIRQPTIWTSDGSLTRLDLPDSSGCGIDPHSRYVVCVAYTGRPLRAIRLDLRTQEQKVLGELAPGEFWQMRFSADGDRMLVLRSGPGLPEVYAMPEGTLTHTLPAAADWIGLSGNGRYAFLGGQDGSLRRYDLDNNALETWIEPVP